jgi:hypothetical protein
MLLLAFGVVRWLWPELEAMLIELQWLPFGTAHPFLMLTFMLDLDVVTWHSSPDTKRL